MFIRFVSFFIVAILQAILVSRPLFAESAMCAIARASIGQASGIRGLKIKKNVPCLVHDREQVKKYLLDTIETKIPAGKLDMEEVVYKTLGFIPENYDYKKGIVDLYVSQIGGYYDPEEHHFVMAAWMPGLLQASVAVHELTHALQDQYFDLSKMIDIKLENSDELMARSALVEGDATAVMIDHTRGLVGQAPLEKEPNVDSFLLQNVLGGSMVAQGAGVPQSLQMMLLFPYTSGLRFAHHLLKKNGYQAINEAFKDPPRSTEEILHFEKYGKAKQDFIVLSDQEVLGEETAVDKKIVYRDTIGEFGISALLGMFLTNKSEVVSGAAGWGGDRVLVLENAEKSKRSIFWVTHWDTEKDADEFYALYLQLLGARFPKASFEGGKDYVTVSPTTRMFLNKQGSFVKFSARVSS